MITTIVTIIGWLWAVGILAALFIIAGAIVVHWTGPRGSGSDPEFLHSPADWEHETGHDCATTTMAMIQTPEVTNVVTFKAQLEAVAAQVEMLARTVRNQAQRIAELEDNHYTCVLDIAADAKRVDARLLDIESRVKKQPSWQEGRGGGGPPEIDVSLEQEQLDIAKDTEALCWYVTATPVERLAGVTQYAARWRVAAEGRLDFEV